MAEAGTTDYRDKLLCSTIKVQLLAPKLRHKQDNDGINLKPAEDHAESQYPFGRIGQPCKIISGTDPADAGTDITDAGQ